MCTSTQCTHRQTHLCTRTRTHPGWAAPPLQSQPGHPSRLSGSARVGELSHGGGTAGDPPQMPGAPTHGAGQVGHTCSADVQEALHGAGRPPEPTGVGPPAAGAGHAHNHSDCTVCCEVAPPRSPPPPKRLPHPLAGAHLGCPHSPWSWSARPSAPRPAQGQKCGYCLKANTGRGHPRAHRTTAPGVPGACRSQGQPPRTHACPRAPTRSTRSPRAPRPLPPQPDCRGTEGPR